MKKNIPPTPHYPNWRYTCPHCLQAHEMSEKLEDFRQPCSSCIKQILQGGYSTMKFTHEGQEYEFRGEYRRPFEGSHALGEDGPFVAPFDMHSVYAIVHPVPKYQIFAGIKFIETGETRHAQYGEWIEGANGEIIPWLPQRASLCTYTILKPVEVL